MYIQLEGYWKSPDKDFMISVNYLIAFSEIDMAADAIPCICKIRSFETQKCAIKFFNSSAVKLISGYEILEETHGLFRKSIPPMRKFSN